MSVYLAEFIGTAFLVLLGDGVVANVVLKRTKGNSSGWVVITLGWACAVLIPALMFGPHGGAVFNPALTLGLASIGNLAWSAVPGYILAQMGGAFFGAILVWLVYKDQFDMEDDSDSILGVFSTGPAIRNYSINFIGEVVATFVLVFTILGIGQTTGMAGTPAAINTFGVGAIIFSCGASLGGTTGYALNPARDLGPRIAHFILPIKNKRDSDWSYSWIPVLGPICGAVLAAFVAKAVFPI